jgi:membrane-associated phospholipid phosphatase
MSRVALGNRVLPAASWGRSAREKLSPATCHDLRSYRAPSSELKVGLYSFVPKIRTDSAKSAESCVSWPSRECRAVFLYYGLLLTLLWLVAYAGPCWVTSLHPYRVQLATKLDLAMPFFPSMVVLYLSLFPMIWIAPFVLQTPQRLRSFAKALALLFVLSGLGFLLIPSDEVRSPVHVDGIFRPVFQFADLINMSHNNLPCLHVGMAVVCARFYSQGKPSTAKAFVWVWAMAIASSTLLTHQHYLADVVAGAALALLIPGAPSTRSPR